MAVQFNKRFLTIILLLTFVALFLLHNINHAKNLTGKPLQLEQELPNSLALVEELPFEPTSTERPRWISPRTLELQQLLKCRNRLLRTQKYQHGNFWVVKNLIAGRQSRLMDCAETITYTTNGDFTFFDNLETLTMRWLAPISFAIFAPGYDLNSTLDAIQYVRNCLPGSEFIVDYVSFHVYFPNDHMPVYLPLDEDEALEWPIKCFNETGEALPPPYLQPRSSMYKVHANLTYPINVGRNIARQSVNTHFIFACDIELFPSMGFVNQFLDMVQSNNSVLALSPEQAPRVYPLPVFEIDEHEHLPNDKSELLALLGKKHAQLFHAKVCANCHIVPGYKDWVNRTASFTEELDLFSMTQRQGKFKYWEPFYVSDNSEPFFDERVTWEGQSNKRIQGYAMCLLGYEYHVLHPAFLVHSPGIKKLSQNSGRLKYVREMNKLIRSKIQPEYRVLYGINKNCVT